MASPTRLIRRSIRNTPIGAAPSDSAITAASARRMNSKSVKGAISASMIMSGSLRWPCIDGAGRRRVVEGLAHAAGLA